jgi:hypothetical protein
LLQGDSNTKYFQLVASGKYRKTRIFQLQHEDRKIEGDQALKEYITSYYKDLFGPPKPSSLSLDETRVEDIEQVSHEEIELLTRPFSIDEVRDAIFQIEHIKAPGQDTRQNFIKHVGRSLKMTSWYYFRNFIGGIYPYTA